MESKAWLLSLRGAKNKQKWFNQITYLEYFQLFK